MLFVIYAIAFALNIGMAWYHNHLRLKAIRNNKPKAIYHGLWALAYTAICFIPFFFYESYSQVISLILLHLSVFPVAYNLFAGLHPYHLSTTSSSIIDRIMVKIGMKSTRLVNVLAFFASLILLIK